MSEHNRTMRAHAIRALSMDAVQHANSGHPGMPMGMADIAEVLWHDFLRHNPSSPNWYDRDRFVLSNGHGSMLLYSLLHLTGYDLSIEDIRNFRQLHSKTPGHPEYGITPGVETTTGPLGQGLASAVGMALSEKMLAAEFNREGHTIVDHHTYVFAGDGCLMEGISHEACSLAGTLGLGKLVVLYDDNGISIDGKVEGWFTDDTPKRFEAYGWHVIPNVDGHDPSALHKAIQEAKDHTAQPTLICCKTVIGHSAPTLAGTSKSHGSPLGAEEIAGTRAQMGWEYPPFVVPEDVYASWNAQQKGSDLEAQWNTAMDAYAQAYPAEAAEFKRRMQGELPENWSEHAQQVLHQAQAETKKMATRAASLHALESIASALPELLGGSADLTGSNKTKWAASTPVRADHPNGNYIYYGVREFGMSAIANGMALHGGYIPFTGTFLVFSDYARNAVRLSALMNTRSIYVYSHDSIGLGEDGPTHQAVEHAESLRIIPNMRVWRPCDLTETTASWISALEHRSGPSCLLLTRQGVQHQPRTEEQVAAIQKGGYILRDSSHPQAVLIATGSEVELATQAADQLEHEGIGVRVVSMPCRELFDQQTPDYKEHVLPSSLQFRVAIEAGVTSGWKGYVGHYGQVIGMDTFGESAPADVLFKHFGITVDNIVETVKNGVRHT